MVKFLERRSLPLLLVPAIVYLLGQNAPAQVTSGAAITSGDLVVYQTYSGSTATTISSVASQVYLDEYSPTGTLVQQIAANGSSPGQPGTASANSQYTLTGSGSATSEGEISLSPKGQYISLTGYNASIGLAGVSSTASLATSRTIGVFHTSRGTIDTSTSINNGFTATIFDRRQPRMARTSTPLDHQTLHRARTAFGWPLKEAHQGRKSHPTMITQYQSITISSTSLMTL